MRALFALISLLGSILAANAQTHAVGNITMIRTGWAAEQFAVVLSVPLQNPAGCSTPDGYISDVSQPGYHTYYAAALTAYAARRVVHVVIHNTECGAAGRPKLIGINLPQ